MILYFVFFPTRRFSFLIGSFLGNVQYLCHLENYEFKMLLLVFCCPPGTQDDHTPHCRCVLVSRAFSRVAYTRI